MKLKLVDRKEKAIYRGDVYELLLRWDRDSVTKSVNGAHPLNAEINKNGGIFALIDCYSSVDDCFFVVKATGKLSSQHEWKVCVYDDINTVSFVEILKQLPL